MKKLFLISFIFIIGVISAYSQDTISSRDAANHIGEKLFVKGKIVYVGTSKNGNVFVNFDEHYPNVTFTAVKFAKTELDISMLKKGCSVIIFGEIKLYKEKPEIILETPEQIIDVKCK